VIGLKKFAPTQNLAMEQFKGAIEIPYQIAVPESQNVYALALQETCPRGVIATMFGMLVTIKLDDELQWCAIEIGNEGTNRMLPPERKSTELRATQT
jgi:hypothetical protein